MTIEYLKKADKTAQTGQQDVEARVREMLGKIEQGGEQAVRDYAAELDGWNGEIVVSEQARADAVHRVPAQLKKDIDLAHHHVRHFAEAQRAAILDTEIEVAPGLIAGHRNIPVARHPFQYTR